MLGHQVTCENSMVMNQISIFLYKISRGPYDNSMVIIRIPLSSPALENSTTRINAAGFFSLRLNNMKTFIYITSKLSNQKRKSEKIPVNYRCAEFGRIWYK
jgi:hypothetical protein